MFFNLIAWFPNNDFYWYLHKTKYKVTTEYFMNANTKMDININRQVHYFIIYKLLICFYPWKNGGIYDQIGEQEQKWYHYLIQIIVRTFLVRKLSLN